jgi:hypothetical protein
MEIDEAKFQRNWRTTLAVCLAYVAILGLVFIVAVYHVAPVVPDKARLVGHRFSSQEARGP